MCDAHFWAWQRINFPGLTGTTGRNNLRPKVAREVTKDRIVFCSLPLRYPRTKGQRFLSQRTSLMIVIKTWSSHFSYMSKPFFVEDEKDLLICFARNTSRALDCTLREVMGSVSLSLPPQKTQSLAIRNPSSFR